MVNQVLKSPLVPLSPGGSQNQTKNDLKAGAPTFLDVYKNILGEAAGTQSQKAADMLDLMLGDVDDLERIQSNITKAQISLELLVNVRNVTLEAYNEIIKMSI
jgi:flagellar hook-basal body complex protein FliE